ncbi:FMN-binding negative transcriptional regulator [Salmonirosea aquatica]|uniref:FMN-binding negative transcriptional regulator n=1 Tax=Salmonirosea aquatica TaxID=2654236 RepID=A0A7C9FQW3_9BACT|nr:FMN-binding negative transcriptional regulator [Cytophagaceae bacterium SJW1-29]
MYIPSTNQMNDRNEIVDFMRRFSFATLISTKEGTPTATHLPFVIELRNDTIVLLSHLARANAHWRYLENQTVLAIFSEPHAYISTKNYDKELNVPTWNYVAVHAYGKVELMEGYEQTLGILEKTIENYESEYCGLWNGFPEAYKVKMTKGIVAFEMTITDIQAKKKLSQNRTDSEKQKIIESLAQSQDTNEKSIADYMMDLSKPNVSYDNGRS